METLNELKGFLFEGAEQTPSVIIYSENLSSRLRYTCKFIFNQGLQINYLLVDNEEEFLKSKLPKINYSVKQVEYALNINPAGLMSQNDINQTGPKYKQNGNPLVFFSDTSDLGFDMFSAVFFCISRYEEWQKFEKDKHGRFELDNSIFKKLGVHKIPVVDLWIQQMKQQLEQKFKIELPKRKYKFVSTIDVDNVYAYKAKPFYRQIGGMLKDIVNFGPRLATILGGKKDPFDAYEEQVELSAKTSIPLIYFFLYRNNTKHDRTIDPNHPEFIKLLQFLNNKGIRTGLHPSYHSTDNPELLMKEQKLLSKNSGKEVIASRQHFLKFDVAETPKQLLRAGIKFDFTMGFASGSGFRAGTTLPFYYYNFETETELELMAVPFTVMDGAFYVYKNTSIKDAEAEIMSLANAVKNVNGLFITVIHDRSFSDKLAPGWKNLYLKLHETLRN